jgi:hypothetical protein
MKKWLLFDGRYRADEDRAVCFEMCDSLKEAKKNAPEYGDDTVIVECDVEGKNLLVNSKIVN